MLKIKAKAQPAKQFSQPSMLAPKPPKVEGGYTQWDNKPIFPGNQSVVPPKAYASMDDARNYVIDPNRSATVGLYTSPHTCKSLP